MQKWGVFPLISKHLTNIFLYNLWIVNAFENDILDLFPVPTRKNLRWLELQGMLIILLWLPFIQNVHMKSVPGEAV